MVTNELWEQAGAVDGHLCIGCLEKRIGRTLNSADFTDALINDPTDPWNTDRLTNRLESRPIPPRGITREPERPLPPPASHAAEIRFQGLWGLS
jgi:hypothetical protein